MAADAIDVRKGKLTQVSRANDDAQADRFGALHSVILAMAAADSAVSSGTSLLTNLANDHAEFARACASNDDELCARDYDAIAASSGG